MERFLHREQAGKLLAEKLIAFANNPNVMVLALPRGGVPVAYEIAILLHAPLDIFIVRKLGMPGHEEMAIGAITQDHVPFFNQDIINTLRIQKSTLDQVIASEQAEVTRRVMCYRKDQALPNVTNKIVILVDDGIATGATMHAAVLALQRYQPTQLIVAVPVADAIVLRDFASITNQVICLLIPKYLSSVGAWYDDFAQTTDQEVIDLLSKANALLGKAYVKKNS